MHSRLQLNHPEASESLNKLTAELKVAVLTATSKSFTIMYIINNSTKMFYFHVSLPQV